MDSVEFLRNEIWPEIRKQLPEAEMHVYGSYVNSRAEQMHDPENGFYIDGRADNAKEVISKAKVLLAPLRFGAGLKGKLVEAMQCGTPSVTTDIGAEGINGEFPWSGEVANNPRDFAAAAVKLYTNKSSWEKAQESGIRSINERFSKDMFGNRIIKRIKNIAGELKSHRLNNFTGQMLMHHTAASTKYMSRWIEEKNS
jgi:glycosyltransferase involved in cell wall biosynthesis